MILIFQPLVIIQFSVILRFVLIVGFDPALGIKVHDQRRHLHKTFLTSSTPMKCRLTDPNLAKRKEGGEGLGNRIQATANLTVFQTALKLFNILA